MSNTINATNSTTSTSSTSNTQQTNSNSTLGKDDFLKLLVTQMENQDPMNPMDNTQSIAQMAQFSSLEQMTNIATAMDTLNTNFSSYNQQSLLAQGASLIGKTVSGLDTDGTTTISGTVEAVKWLDSNPKLQVRESDGSLVDLEMSMITQVQS
ncbi:flagellar hook capping protein [Desulfosporosinus acidiphilus SJ4]|uniref:Flagellar hook capping protein n=1 Tax=Desulfosporosinus acidiphilus (strain DSM 22704 / JCM 16185 / SJ4) TaxID=646529 RepID=I4DA60_DESAJ|nr:flagellar hook capping FlgD N-terminal domain-containing protein [Desulfosporosinus acidiphilus]AFM42684.1 flagellar hook capping protein [Desulfosporosinus acidiphilus SJ4]